MVAGAHVLAGFSLAFRFRGQLSRILNTTPAESSIRTLDPALLKGEGIKALALDFDGVLAPHGFPAPLPAAEEWLTRCVACFGADKVFILSNKPTEGRRRWFGEHFPHIRFISGVRKKPFPDGLARISELAEVPLSAILMVDDRLLTGCLAALNAGARPLYVSHPSVSLMHRPMAELFFMLLRSGERALIGVFALLP